MAPYLRPNPAENGSLELCAPERHLLELTIKMLSTGPTKHICGLVARLRSRGSRSGRRQTTFWYLFQVFAAQELPPAATLQI